MVLPDSRGAMGRDIVVPFREADVAELLRRFDELARRSATSGARVGDEAGELRALGERLGEALLGGDGEAARLISRIPADRLMIRLQKDLVHIPWELIVTRAGGQYLWQSFGLSRQLRTAAGESGTASQLKAPLHVLLLANLEAGVPGRDLPAAEREAAEIMDLGAKNPELMRVTRKSPQTAAELSALLGQEFDVIHYASHASYAGEGRTGWVLPDGSVLTGRELQSLNGRVPSLVFANACNVSGPTGLVESRSGDLAETFLTWGVSAYLGTLWEVSDAAGADFARVFYRCLLGGEALADCINTARAALLRGAGIAWANYVLYGDPELRLTAAGRD